MAYVINPDGTITIIETTHDQYGNLKPKIGPQEKSFSSSSGHVIAKDSVGSKKKHKAPKKTRPVFTNAREIDEFFEERKRNGRTIYFIEYSNLLELIPNSLQHYFKKQYLEYKDNYISDKPKSIRERVKDLVKYKAIQQKKLKKKQKTKQNSTQKNNQIDKQEAKPKPKQKQSCAPKNTLGDIATISSLGIDYTDSKDIEARKRVMQSLRAPIVKRAKEQQKKAHSKPVKKSIEREIEPEHIGSQLASSSDYEVRTSNPPRPARAPKYAYARDRFGRVQERDSFNEEKGNEFYVAQNMQRDYDYSSYDSNDDNDGAYKDWE